MYKKLFLAAALMGLMLSCPLAMAADYIFKLPQGIKIGEISGPGREQLKRALKKRTQGGSASLILSGHVQLWQSSQAEREMVPLPKPSGEPYEDYLPDPFTGKAWRQKVQPTVTTIDAFDFQRYLGIMTLDWTLTASGSKEVVDQGRVLLDINRTRGGYLSTEGVVPGMSAGGRADKIMEARLADDLVRLLSLDLGRAASASELESGKDEWSRRAKKLASLGDWDGARNEWETLLGLNPKYGPALYNLGIYYERGHNPEKALDYYRAAFLSDGSVLHRMALTRLTETLRLAGRLPGRMSQREGM